MVAIFLALSLASSPTPGATTHKSRDSGAAEVSEKEVRNRLRGQWEEWEGGKPVKGAEADIEWEFLGPGWVNPNLAVATYPKSESQQITHTLRLNVHKNPMWLDLFHDDGGRERVMLAIFKFEGDHLILIEGDTVDAKVWEKAKGNLPGRPKDFRHGRAGHVRRVLIRQ